MSLSVKQRIDEIRLPLAETQSAFVESPAPIPVIIGPEGEGKTYAGFIGVLYHSQARMDGPLAGAVIRDTFENFKSKTVDSINKAILKIAQYNEHLEYVRAWRWKDGYKTLLGPHGIRLDAFGANDPADRTRLQGSDKWSLIWLDDPVPMFAHNNSGVPEYIFDDCISRAARGGGGMRLQITMNPSDREHWTYKRLIENPINEGEVFCEVFFIPYGENPARTALMRQATATAYKNDPALYARLVKGEFAFAQLGEPVTPEYSDAHFTNTDIKVIKGAKGFRSWDGGHNPCCLLGQITPNGRLQFIHGLILPGKGMKQLIDSQVKPIVNLYYKGISEWYDTGDPSLITGDDSDTEQSPARVIEKAFDTYFDPASHWPAPKEAMKSALNTMIEGKPFVEVGKQCGILDRALRGGWHYVKLPSGMVIREKPLKDKHSHPGDCFGAVCLKLLGNTGAEMIEDDEGNRYHHRIEQIDADR